MRALLDAKANACDESRPGANALTFAISATICANSPVVGLISTANATRSSLPRATLRLLLDAKCEPRVDYQGENLLHLYIRNCATTPKLADVSAPTLRFLVAL